MATGALALLALACALAPVSARAELHLGSPNLIINQPLDDTVMGLGATVTINAPISQGALLAGGTVMVRAPIGDKLAATGGTIIIAAPVAGDLQTASGTVTLAPGAMVGGNATLLAGSAVIDGTINGDLTLTGGTLAFGGTFLSGQAVMDGVVNGNLTLKGGTLALGGTVMGDVDATAGHMVLRPGAHIHGNVRFAGSDALALPPGAVIDGTVDYSGTPHRHLSHEAHSANGSGWGWNWHTDDGDGARPGFGLHLGSGSLIKGVGFFVIGLVLYLLFPGLVRDSAGRIATHPGASILVGLLCLILLPVLMLVLCVTLIGIPVAGLVLLVYLAGLLVAWPLGAHGIADWACARRRGPPTTPGQRIRRYAVTVAVLTLLSLSSTIDMVLGPLLVILGFGGLMRQLTRRTPGMGY